MKQNKRLRFFNARGTTLVEVIVAVGILTAIVGAMAKFFGQTFNTQDRVKIRSVMQFLAQDIENKIKAPSSIYLSLLDPSNSIFTQCVLASEQGCSTALQTLSFTNFNYFALNYATGTTGAASMTTALATSPMYYDTNGLPCQWSKENRNCIFKAVTFFYVSCDPTDEVPCKTSTGSLKGPVEIHVGYQVSQIPNVTNTALATTVLKPIPGTIRFYTHKLIDILGANTNSTCNPGAIIAGYDRQGTPVCKCTSPYITDTNLAPNALGPLCRKLLNAELTCPNNLLFRGLTPEGKANCVDPNQAYNCQSIPYIDGVSERCPTGSWVQQDSRTGCQFSCTVPKASSMSCNFNEAADDRLPGGLRPIHDYIQPEAQTLSAVDQRRNVNQNYPIGMVCTGRTLVCCHPL